MADERARNIEPGPKEWGVLNEEVQQSHRSQVVWNTGFCKALRVRRASQGSLGDVHHPDLIPLDLQQHLMRAGFWHVSRMKRLPIDKNLISALVERWRPETHTFHMPVGEMTITLQDVEGILGLSTEGRVVSGRTHGNWAAVMQQYMGRTPLPSDLTGGNIKMSWFDRYWGHWEEHSATVESQLLYTRAYLMRLFGGFLMCDKSSSEVPCRYIQLLGGDLAETATYSWGSAVLAILFRELCQATIASAKDIGGCLLLLQIWAWLRFPAISPPIPPPSDGGDHYGRRFNNVDVRLLRGDLKTYRIELDQMGRDDVKWEPYKDAGYEFMGADVHMQDMWRAVTPVLAFHIVEMHQPDRCMRQFGMQQHIPSSASQLQGVHDLTLRGKMTDDWEVKMDPHIQLWSTRHLRIKTTDPSEGPISPNSEYMTWFFTHTRRYMTRQVAKIGHVVDSVEWIWLMNSPQFDAQFSKRQVQEVCDQLLRALREFGRVAETGPNAPTGLLVGVPDPPLEVPPHAKEGRGLGKRRLRNAMQAYEVPQSGPHGEDFARRGLQIMAQTEMQSNGCGVQESSPNIQNVEHNSVVENPPTFVPFLRVKKLSNKAILPSRASSLSAGYDLSSAVKTKVPARGKALVATDLSIAIPEGTYGCIAPCSGLAWKHSIDVGAGVIDADYRGPVGVILFNHSDIDFEVKVGDRIAQLIIERILTPEVEEVADLDSTARGEGGFGSTGV